MFRNAQRSLWLPLSMSISLSSPHLQTSTECLSTSPSDEKREQHETIQGVIRKTNVLSESTEPSWSSGDPFPPSTIGLDVYTQEIIKYLKLPPVGTSILGLYDEKSAEEKANQSIDFSEYKFLDLVPRAILDNCTKSSLRELARVCENIVSHYQKNVTRFNHPCIVNLGLLRLYCIKREGKRREQIMKQTHLLDKTTSSNGLTKSAGETDVFLTTVRHFMRFADDVYEDQSSLYLAPSEIIVQGLRDIHVSDEGNRPLHPHYAVFFDHLTKSVVVVIRGTACVSDIITDLCCGTRHFLHDFMRAHTGMSAAAEELLPHIQNALDRAFKYKDGSFNDYKIVITGHSLGAGTACLLSMLLADRLPRHQITTFAFAPPPILTVEESAIPRVILTSGVEQAAQTNSNATIPCGSPPLPHNLTIHSFIFNQDLIPRCSMHEFVNMLLAVRAIDQDTKWTCAKRVRLLLQGDLDDDDMQVLNEVLSSSNTRKKDSKEELDPSEDFQLVIPGHLYWILPRESEISPHSCYHDGQAFDLVRLHSCHDVFTGSLFTGDDMFRDHLAGSYKAAMLSVTDFYKEHMRNRL